MKQMHIKKNIAIHFAISVTVLACGWLLLPYLVQWQIAKKMVISPTDSPKVYQAWLQPPVPLYLKIYLFNASNPNEIENGFNPTLTQMGPYVFQEFRQKLNVSLDDPSDTATYNDHIVYKFRKDLSGNLSLSDNITLINVPFAAAAIKIEKDLPWLLRHVAHMILLNYKEPPFITKTVNEVLFQGWKVPFLEQIEKEIGLSLVANNSFGLFVGLNDTSQGPYTINRGILGDKNRLGGIVAFQNRESLEHWGNSDTNCNQILGTDGLIFPPNIDKSAKLYVFNPELCRSLYLAFEKYVEFRGISGFRFTPPPSLLEDPRKSRENRCFCREIDSYPENCLGKGSLDLGSCQDGAPVAMSTAHFLNADTKYLEYIRTGLAPNPEYHEAFVDIEPMTGAVLQAHNRLQLNLIMKRVGSIPSLSKMKDNVLFPLLWIDEGAKLDSIYLEKLKSVLFWIRFVEMVSKFGALTVVGCLLVLNILGFKAQKRDECERYNSSEQSSNLTNDLQERLPVKLRD